jgi:hypothetical protein
VSSWADERAAKVEDKTRAWERLAEQGRAEQSRAAQRIERVERQGLFRFRWEKRCRAVVE